MAVGAIYSIERQLKPEDDAVTRAEVNTLSVVMEIVNRVSGIGQTDEV